MKPNTPTKARGLTIARRLKERCIAQGIPVENVYLFGSLATGAMHRWSDVDIAIVYKPFAALRGQERRRIRALREDFDVPMDILCLRSEDMANDYVGIAREVQEKGIPV
ncbi:MAG: nucleotidyltransferase domain-containing protein [Candidatus Peregrinibacteria bacterium]